MLNALNACAGIYNAKLIKFPHPAIKNAIIRIFDQKRTAMNGIRRGDGSLTG